MGDRPERSELEEFDARRRRRRREAAEGGRELAKGLILASLLGLGVPFLIWFFAPLFSGILALVTWIRCRPVNRRTFAGGLFLGCVVWFLIHGSCSAYFLLVFSLH